MNDDDNLVGGVEDGVTAIPAEIDAPVERGGPPLEHPHHQLWHDVRRALFAIPTFFKTKLTIAGVKATDIHSLNSSLGASIEQSVVDQLNELRDIWDPTDEHGARAFQHLAFKRQSASWPDVLLTSGMPGDIPVMGIELKGWFVLSKEGEPSFRYKVNPEVCTDLDLVAVYPWSLDEVLSGNPFLLTPFVAEARFTAEMRNHYWRHSRISTGNAEITPAKDQGHYPKCGAKFLDTAVSDPGSNFGRASRAGIMKAFIAHTFQETIAGIPISAWAAFFKTFGENTDLVEATHEIRARRATLHVDIGEESGLAKLLRQMLDYASSVSGKDINDVAHRLRLETPKIIGVVSLPELKAAFRDGHDTAELIILKAGPVSIAATGVVATVRSRVAAIEKAAGEDVVVEQCRLELVLNEDNLFKISAVKAM